MQGVVEVMEEQLKEALGGQAYDVGHVQDLDRHLRDVSFKIERHHCHVKQHGTWDNSLNFDFAIQLYLP